MKAMLIGLGHIAQVHIKCLMHLNIDIVAICDIDFEKCTKVVSDYELVCNIYMNYKDMIEKEDAEVVHICTPHYLHPDMIQFCLKKEKKFLLKNHLLFQGCSWMNLSKWYKKHQKV